MATNVNRKIRKLSPAQRKKVEARAAELLKETRKAAGRHSRVRLPLIRSRHPGTVDLTNAEIEDLLT